MALSRPFHGGQPLLTLPPLSCQTQLLVSLLVGKPCKASLQPRIRCLGQGHLAACEYGFRELGLNFRDYSVELGSPQSRAPQKSMQPREGPPQAVLAEQGPSSVSSVSLPHAPRFQAAVYVPLGLLGQSPRKSSLPDLSAI